MNNFSFTYLKLRRYGMIPIETTLNLRTADIELPTKGQLTSFHQ